VDGDVGRGDVMRDGVRLPSGNSTTIGPMVRVGWPTRIVYFIVEATVLLLAFGDIMATGTERLPIAFLPHQFGSDVSRDDVVDAL
jgi:hypothetical protein